VNKTKTQPRSGKNQERSQADTEHTKEIWTTNQHRAANTG